MSVQTSFGNPSPGVPGMLADTGPHDIITRVAEEALAFGSFVKYDDDSCELPDSSGEVTGNGRGIALVDPTKKSGTGYEIGDLVQILVDGRAWVASENALTALTAPFVRHTAGAGGSTKGAFRSDADTASATQVVGAQVERTNGSNLAVVAIRQA
jgi:hypothetical protein